MKDEEKYLKAAGQEFARISREAECEFIAASKKFGIVRSYSMSEWMNVLMEEVGEASKELNDYRIFIDKHSDLNNFTNDEEIYDEEYAVLTRLRCEMIQIMSVAGNMIRHIDIRKEVLEK